jgi:hypothetical protein
MATLTSTKIKNTYDALLKSIDNDAIGTTAKQITDGLGNLTPLYISTTQIGIGVTPESGLNLHVFGDAKIGSNLTVIGNLVVEGSTTTVGTDTLTVKDPLIVLANNNTSTDAVDIGFYGKYTPSGTTLYSGLFREALTGKYRLFKDLQEEPTTTVNTSGTGYAQATLIAALEGNVTGNVTGNLIGSVTGGTFSGTLLSNVVATTQSAGDNSTKVATTAYVDNQVGLYDTLSEVLANGNTTGGTDIVVSTSDQIFIPYGSATNPSIAFSNDTDNGIYGVTNSLNITVGGTIRASFSPNFIQFRPDGFTRFSVDYNGIFAYLDTEIQGDLIVDTDTLFVDASEDSVGINTANPSSYSKHELVITAPDEGGITIASGTDEAAYLAFADSTSSPLNYIRVDHDGDAFEFHSNSTFSFQLIEGVEVLGLSSVSVDIRESTTIHDTLTVDDNATFAGDVTLPSGYLNVTTDGSVAYGLIINSGDQSHSRIRINNTGSGGNAWSIMSGTSGVSNDGFAIRNETTTTTALQFTNTGNATFAGTINTNATAELMLSLNTTAANGGYLRFRESDVTKFFIGARGAVSGGTGTGYDIYTAAGNDLRLWTAGATALTIDTSQNVGIGNSNPSAFGKFVVQGTGNLLNLNATSGKVYQAFYENGVGRFYLNTLNGSDGLAFTDADGATERMRIDSSGFVLINTDDNSMKTNSGSADLSQFKVNGSLGYVAISDSGAQMEFSRDNDNYIYASGAAANLHLGTAGSLAISIDENVVGKALITDDVQLTGSSPRIDFNSNGSSSLRFYDTTNATERMRIDSSGNVGHRN